MTAFRRLGGAFLAIAAAAMPAPATSQTAEQDAQSNAPAAQPVGPRELQNFNLQGTVTRPADPAPAPRASAPATRPPAASRSTTAETRTVAPARASAETVAEAPPSSSARTASGASPRTPQARSEAPSLSSVTVSLPPADSVSGTTVTPAAASSDFAADPDAGTFAPAQGPSLWPWLLAAVALGAGGAFLFWRRSSREAFAGGPQVDAFVAPEPPPPRPEAAPPQSTGIVSTRLRPWIDIEFTPLRCVVEEAQVRFEFELGLFNSGSGPARDVLIEAVMINASGTQDREIGAFFAKPAGVGERIPGIPPLKRITLRPQVTVPMDQVRVLEAAGRRVFVPLIAFNALYRWGGGEGQTSAVYLLGRDTKGEKMAPFRLDLGPRLFRAVAARVLPDAIRK